jgi:hypothetical protein
MEPNLGGMVVYSAALSFNPRNYDRDIVGFSVFNGFNNLLLLLG